MRLRKTRLSAIRSAYRDLFRDASLRLEFTRSLALDPRITFSRTSNATQFDSSGNLVYAPHNLLTQSESFDSSVWSLTDITLSANNTQSPDGTTTADLVAEGSAGTAFLTRGAGIVVPGGATIAASCYVKRSAVVNWVRFRLSNSAATNGGNVWFDIQNGALGTAANIGSGTGTAGAIQAVGNGWYRLSVTTTIASADTTGLPLLCSASADNNTGRAANSAYWVWGAQLNVGTLQPYYPTTVKNLLGYTQEFDNAAWSKGLMTVTANAAVAPDGSTTADLIDTATETVGVYPSQTAAVTSGTPFVLSVYVKAGTAGFLRLRTGLASGSSSIWYDITNRTFATAGLGWSGLGSVDVGNGWYRVSARITYGASDGGSRGISIVPTSSFGGTTPFGTVFLWGAQLSDSASLDQYVYNPVAAPASTAYYGPRFDYDPVTLAARGLLIEEQRTNSIRNNTMVGAVAGTPGTLPTNWATSLAGLTQEVVGTGTESGITYIDIRFSGTTTGTQINVFLETITGNAAINGTTYVWGLYWRIVAGALTNISSTGLVVNGYDSGGAFLGGAFTVGSYVGSPTPSSTLSRVSRSYTGANASLAFGRPGVFFVTTVGSAIDFTIRLGLPQFETGAFITSPILTTTAAATRTADVATMQGANFSNWYRQDEGTVYAEYAIPFDSSTSIFPIAVAAADGTFSNSIALYTRTIDDARYAAVRVGGVEQANITSGVAYVYGTVSKQAATYKINDFATSVGGAAVGTDTSGTVPVVDRLGMGTNTVTGGSLSYLNGHLRRISYYPRRLADSELQAISQ
jgi:hypothetical protein